MTDTARTPTRSSSDLFDSPQASAVSMPAGSARPSKLLGKPLEAHDILTLQEMAARHPYADFRRRALGLLALQRGHKVAHICELLQVSDQPVYNWAKGYRTQGLAGILDGHKGGHHANSATSWWMRQCKLPASKRSHWARLPSNCTSATPTHPASVWSACRCGSKNGD